LGGEDLNVKQVSEHLKVPHGFLSKLFHGQQPVSQKTLINKQWREVLAREYGEGWRAHADEFERYAATLPVRLARKKRDTNSSCIDHKGIVEL